MSDGSRRHLINLGLCRLFVQFIVAMVRFFDGGLLAAVTAPPRRLMNLPKPRRHYFQFLALLGFCLLVSLLVSRPSFSSRLSNLRPCSMDVMVSR
jgi:hypothetical protein